MLIKQITNYPLANLEAGSVIEWDETEAVRMLAAGLVEAVEQPTRAMEKATRTKGKPEVRS